MRISVPDFRANPLAFHRMVADRIEAKTTHATRIRLMTVTAGPGHRAHNVPGWVTTTSDSNNGLALGEVDLVPKTSEIAECLVVEEGGVVPSTVTR
jgi:hypothetical protein